MQLRPYQQQCLNNILARRLTGVRRQLVSMATGLGKSLIFSSLPHHMNSSQRMLMMVHTEELVTQGAAHLLQWNPSLNLGIEMGRYHHADDSHQIVVASVSTIGRNGSNRIKKFDPKDFAWIVVDEAHHSTADTYKNVFEHFGLLGDTQEDGPVLVGLSATPNRSDGQALGQIYDEIVFQYGIRDGVRDGWLVEPRGYNIKIDADLSSVSSSGDDFQQEELARVLNTPEYNDAIVREWIQHAWPRPTFAFTTNNIKHAQDLAFAFQKAGVPAEAIWGDDPERSRKLKDYDAGRLLVLVNAKLLTEGVDVPKTSCVLFVRITKSQPFFIQAAGRGFRLDGVGNLVEARQNNLITQNTKTDCLVMCVAAQAGRHSLVTLPTLFGLPAKLDLKGRSVVQAAQMVEEAQASNPGLDINKLEDITKLKTYVEEANLWEVRFAEEVTEYSKLQWHKSSQGAYVLLLPNKESMCIFENLLGKFNVVGSIKGAKYDEQGFNSLPDAFNFAEMNLSLHGKELMTLLRRESKWMKGEVTPAQLKQLKRFRVPEHIIANLDKGGASKLLAKKFGGLQ